MHACMCSSNEITWGNNNDTLTTSIDDTQYMVFDLINLKIEKKTRLT